MNIKVLRMFSLDWFIEVFLFIIIMIGVIGVFVSSISASYENSFKRDCVYLLSGESITGKAQYFYSGTVLQVTSEVGVIEYPSDKVSKVVKDCIRKESAK